MTSVTRWLNVVIVAAALSTVPLLAHHSFDAEFDRTKSVTLRGTVTKFEFINPHSWIHLDVKDESGKVVAWRAETGNPGSLLRRGWKKDSLKPGDEIVIEGFRAKNGSPTANAVSVKLADGRTVFAGSSSGLGKAADLSERRLRLHRLRRIEQVACYPTDAA